METVQHWPDGNQCAALFSFDLDAESGWLARIDRDSAWDKPPIRTRGRFGPRVAVPRILQLFDRLDLNCTFFVPGTVIEAWPETVLAIHEAGHEIAHHGYTHTNPAAVDPETERMEFARTIDLIEDLTGHSPVGYRSPGSDLSNHTLELLAEHELLYDSTLIDNDTPYLHDLDAGSIVEIPFEWSLDDWPYFGYNSYPPLPYQSGIDPIGPVFDAWRREFDGIREYGRCFVLTMHPQVIGRAGRISALEDFLEHVINTGDTWIATGEEIAAHALSGHYNSR